MTKDHWSEYWKSGVLTSLPSDFKENYDGELAAYWETVISGFDDANILDLCTGNGAVALLLSELANKHSKNVNITAIDASAIQPENVLLHFPEKQQYMNSINFVGNRFVENLAADFSSEAFDLIVSQYGIEYCDTEEAAKNIVACLKPEGKLIFIAHSPDSAMLEYMNDEEKIYQIIEEAGLFNALTQFVAQKTSANKFKNQIEAGLNHLGQHREYMSKSLFKTWGQTIYKMFKMNNAEIKAQRHNLKKFVETFKNARQRSLDMINVSNKLLNEPDWYKAFELNGLKLLDEGTIRYKGQHNVGHYYEFVLPV